jgi:hypothetical protein
MLEDGTDRLYRNVGKELQHYSLRNILEERSSNSREIYKYWLSGMGVIRR